MTESVEKAAPTVPKAPPWYATLRQDAPGLLPKVLGLACLALILLVWFLFTRGATPDARPISPSKLPSPGEVLDAFGTATSSGLFDSIIATLMRVLIGFLYATVVGVGLGVVAGSFRAVLGFLSPLVLFGRSVPLAALIPLTILWFGIDETQKQMFIFLASVPFVFSDTVKAISLVPQRYVETAETLGATRFQIVRKVLLPLALPDIVTSLRILFGLALGYIMLAEVINQTGGLGAMIETANRRGNSALSYFLLFVIAALAYAVDWVIHFLQRQAFPYRKDL